MHGSYSLGTSVVNFVSRLSPRTLDDLSRASTTRNDYYGYVCKAKYCFATWRGTPRLQGTEVGVRSGYGAQGRGSTLEKCGKSSLYRELDNRLGVTLKMNTFHFWLDTIGKNLSQKKRRLPMDKTQDTIWLEAVSSHRINSWPADLTVRRQHLSEASGKRHF